MREVKTKTMAPLTKAMNPAKMHTKDMARAGRGHADEAEAEEPRAYTPFAGNTSVMFDYFGGLVRELVNAARGISHYMASEPVTYRPHRISNYDVDERDCASLDDDDLARYIRELEKTIERAHFACKTQFVYARNAEADYKAAVDAIVTLSSRENIDAVRKALSDHMAYAAENHRAYVRMEEGLKARLADARAEAERREPKSVAAMSRELDELRSQLDELRGAK